MWIQLHVMYYKQMKLYNIPNEAQGESLWAQLAEKRVETEVGFCLRQTVKGIVRPVVHVVAVIPHFDTPVVVFHLCERVVDEVDEGG